jgi:hypothetical protein
MADQSKDTTPLALVLQPRPPFLYQMIHCPYFAMLHPVVKYKCSPPNLCSALTLGIALHRAVRGSCFRLRWESKVWCELSRAGASPHSSFKYPSRLPRRTSHPIFGLGQKPSVPITHFHLEILTAQKYGVEQLTSTLPLHSEGHLVSEDCIVSKNGIT